MLFREARGRRNPTGRHWAVHFRLTAWLGVFVAGFGLAGLPASRALADDAAKVQTFDNYALTGAEYRALHVDAIEQCVAACASDAECQASDMNKWSGQCSLKHDVGALRFDPRFVATPVKTSAPPPQAEEPMELRCLSSANFNGAPLPSQSADSADRCSTMCETQESCVAFSYSAADKACKLFGSVSSRFDVDGVLAGYKLQVTKGSEAQTQHCFAPPPAPVAAVAEPAPAAPAPTAPAAAEPTPAPVLSAVVAVGKLGRTRVHWEAVWNIEDLEATKTATLERCAKMATQCQVAWTSGPKCIAVAYLRDGWSVQSGANEYDARSLALSACQRVNGTKCTLGGSWCNKEATK